MDTSVEIHKDTLNFFKSLVILYGIISSTGHHLLPGTPDMTDNTLNAFSANLDGTNTYSPSIKFGDIEPSNFMRFVSPAKLISSKSRS